MANTLGSLVVKLGLDAAEFVSGLTKAEFQAKKFSDQSSIAFKKLGTTLAGLGAGAAIGAFIKSTIESAAALDRMATATGATVEELSRFQKVAKITGTGSIDEISAGLQRLTRSMQGADEQSKGAGVAFAALGIKTRDSAGNLRDSGAVMEEVAKTLDKYADGANKTAIAQALFGRAGAELLPFLKELAQNQEIVGKVTTEQAANAKKLEEEWRKLTAAGSALGQMVLNDLVPPVLHLLELLRDARGAGDDLADSLRVLAQLSPFKSNAENIEYLNKQITETEQKIKEVKAAAGGFWATIAPSSQDTSNLEENVREWTKARDIALASQLRGFGGPPTNAPPGGAGRPQAPAIPKVGGDGSIKAAKEAIADYTNEIQKLKDALDPLTEQYPKLTAAQEKIMADMQAGKSILWDTADAYLRTARALDEHSISAKEAAAAQKILDEELKQAEAIEKRATDAIGAYTEQLDAFEKGIGIIGKGAQAYDLLNAELEHNKRLKIATADTVDIENAQYERQKRLIAAYHEANEVLQQQIEYNRIFADSFADAAVAVVTGTKSIGEAFRDMEKQIVAAISRIAAQNIANTLFGVNPQSGGGGIGALFAALFAGSAGGAPNFGTYATGPGMAQLGGPGGGLAAGTDYWHGGSTWVGEHGPEIVNLPRGAQVIPFDRAKGAGGVTINITVPGSTSRASADQIAQQTGIAVARAMRRNS